MNKFIEECVADKDFFAEDSADEQVIMRKVLLLVLPLILENELSEKQSLCLRLFYLHGKKQSEIARQLHISQPTVSRHIISAKAITLKIMNYCMYCVKKANEQWIKMQ